MSVVPADFGWRQSTVGALLRCPERFRREHLLGEQPDHRVTHFAAPLGTADHAGIELILEHTNDGEVPEQQLLLDRVIDAFTDAVAEDQDKGAAYDPDSLERTLERIEQERLPRLMALANDPRVHAIEWLGIEWGFDFRERSGRRWHGTLDAWGIARQDVEDFGALGRESVGLRRGDKVLVDWKTGMCPPFGLVERTRSVQLGLYRMALSREFPGEWRTFLGLVQDLDRPSAPTDADGKRIKKHLPKAINPEFMAAIGTGDEAEARASKRKPRDEAGESIPKWLPERVNPEFEEACSKPKGPFFREARVDLERVLVTVRDAIRGAELGLFPASGALTGQCSLCPFQTTCTNNPHEETDA